jgi:hypothetical protein
MPVAPPVYAVGKGSVQWEPFPFPFPLPWVDITIRSTARMPSRVSLDEKKGRI